MSIDARGRLWLDNPLLVLGLLSVLWVLIACLHSRAAGYAGTATLRQLAQRLLDRFSWIGVVLQRARQVGVVGGHVEVAVARQIEQNDPLLTRFAGAQRLVDRRSNGVRRLGRGNDALGARELDGRLEHAVLRVGQGLDHAVVDQLAEQRRGAVVAQATRVDGRRHEAVAERVHLDQRRQADRVAKVVGVRAAGQCRAGFGLDGDDAGGSDPRAVSRRRTGTPGRRSWTRRRRSRSPRRGTPLRDPSA